METVALSSKARVQLPSLPGQRGGRALFISFYFPPSPRPAFPQPTAGSPEQRPRVPDPAVPPPATLLPDLRVEPGLPSPPPGARVFENEARGRVVSEVSLPRRQ